MAKTRGPRKPKTCYGNEHVQHHAEGCRPARPLCRWMRKVQPQRRACGCDAYHFPHRAGSGRCGNAEKMWEFVYGPDAVNEWAERDAIANENNLEPVKATGSDDDTPF